MIKSCFSLAHDCITLIYTCLPFNTNYHPLTRSTSHAFVRRSFVYVTGYLLGHSPEKAGPILGHFLPVQALRSQVAVHGRVPGGVPAAAGMALLPSAGPARRIHVHRAERRTPLVPHGEEKPRRSSGAGRRCSSRGGGQRWPAGSRKSSNGSGRKSRSRLHVVHSHVGSAERSGKVSCAARTRSSVTAAVPGGCGGPGAAPAGPGAGGSGRVPGAQPACGRKTKGKGRTRAARREGGRERERGGRKQERNLALIFTFSPGAAGSRSPGGGGSGRRRTQRPGRAVSLAPGRHHFFASEVRIKAAGVVGGKLNISRQCALAARRA